MNASENHTGYLVGKRMVITGASRGLGEVVTRLAWQAGASLLLVARDGQALQVIRDSLQPMAQPEQTIETVATDLATSQAAAAIFAKVDQHWQGRIDILVNNAAIVGPIGTAWTNDWNEWQKALHVNLLTPVALCQAAVTRMVSRGGGKIINLSGGGATGPRPNFSAYGTAKTALVRFSETLAVETQALNVQVNCVAPGAMKTRMTQAVLTAGSESAGENEVRVAMKLSAKDDATIGQAARLCLFLASSVSDGITGKLISAVWDPWEDLGQHAEELRTSDVYTLRRIVPKDRGMTWGDK